ncbi:MAG: alpha-amylase [Muribaculaceae bacterium]|nr:alpha-amylase [Muribaculaceae bacterium]
MKRFIAAAAAVAAFFGFACAQQPAHTTVAHPEWSRNAVIYEVNTRQYTPEGTFEAFRTHIPRLKELGVDILWFMPIHPISELNRKGELGSYYAVADYKGVNPEFGTLDDFKRVVTDAHAAGMKVIIDWVPNHTGCDNAWVKNHPEYYQLNEEGKMYGPYDWTDVYQLDYGKRATREAMIDAMSYWLTEAGIDGFRCDVAGRVPVDFWNEARTAFDTVAQRPVFMLAEATEPELMEHAFDMDYNWPMKDLFSHIAATSGQYHVGDNKPDFPVRHAADIDSLLREQAAKYPVDSYMMNMITNHDLNSWEGTEFERLGNLADAFAVLSYTLPGMPLIYTGQETGLNRAIEFFVKDTPPAWEPRNRYFEFYKSLNALKHSRPELSAGEKGGKGEILHTASPDVIAFIRHIGNSATFVAANLGTEDSKIFGCPRCTPKIANATDAISGKTLTAIPETLAPGEYVVATYNPEQ